MNPHTQDYRDTARAGEKTGSAFGSDRDFRSKRFATGSGIIAGIIVGPFVWALIIWAGFALCR